MKYEAIDKRLKKSRAQEVAYSILARQLTEAASLGCKFELTMKINGRTVKLADGKNPEWT